LITLNILTQKIEAQEEEVQTTTAWLAFAWRQNDGALVAMKR